MAKAILELEMPESCRKCPCSWRIRDNVIACEVTKHYCPEEGRHKDCPLKLVEGKEVKRAMTHKVKFTHSGKSRAHKGRAKVREGKEVYRHPEGRFIVLEFQGNGGKFREAFWPEEIVKDKLFL